MPTAKKLPSGSYRCRVFDGRTDDGKPKYRSFTASTKKQAEFLAAEYAAKKKRSAPSMTVGEAIDRYIDSKDGVLSPKTIAEYRRSRRNYLQGIMNVRLDRLTREQVQIAVTEQSKTVSAKTVINAHGLLSAALKMHNPDFVLHTTLPRKVRQLRKELPTSDEVMRAVHGSPVELPVLLALCLCLRVSEVRGIRKDSVRGDSLFIERVIVTADGQHIEKELAKTDASRREIELPAFLKAMIMNAPTDYATTMTGQAIYKAFTRRMESAGFSHVRFHDLRHISASDMHRSGISDKAAADRGGWASTQTMRQVYQHSFATDRQKADHAMNEQYSAMFSAIDENSGHGKNV